MQTSYATHPVAQPSDAAACAACAASYLKMCAKCKALGNAQARHDRRKVRAADRARVAVMTFVFKAFATLGVLLGMAVQAVCGDAASAVVGTLIILGSLGSLSYVGNTYRRDLADFAQDDQDDLIAAQRDIEAVAREAAGRK